MEGTTMLALHPVSRTALVQLPTFDLSEIREQVRSDARFLRWSDQRLDRAILEYRRFLALCKHYPRHPIGLSEDADCVWHLHILNSRMYMAHCDEYFGDYFHHTPVATPEEQKIAQQGTDSLYLEAFGEPRLLDIQATCVGGGCMNNG